MAGESSPLSRVASCRLVLFQSLGVPPERDDASETETPRLRAGPFVSAELLRSVVVLLSTGLLLSAMLLRKFMKLERRGVLGVLHFSAAAT